jgi:hypothetical protein
MKQIRFILILAIGGVLFWVVLGLGLSYQPPSDWVNVIPSIDRLGSMNLTTSTFNITSDKWGVFSSVRYPSQYSLSARFDVEVHNASTDEKLQQFTLSTDFVQISDSKELSLTGSFCLKIQVYGVYGEIGHWGIQAKEYNPQPSFPIWATVIAVIGIALLVVLIGYEIYGVISK